MTREGETIVELLLFIWMHIGEAGLHALGSHLVSLDMDVIQEDIWTEFHKRRDAYREYLKGEKERLSKVMP